MDFVIENPPALSAALARINRAADDSPRNLTGVHAHIRVLARENSLELLARDDIVAAATSVSAPVHVEGGCCIPLRLLHAVLERAPAHPISVRLYSNDTLHFEAPRWRRTIAVLSVSAMQDLPVAPRVSARVPADVVRRVLGPTVHAADTDPERQDRGCVVLRRSKSYIEAFASDSHRASYARVRFEDAFDGQVVIHQRALREIQKVLDLADVDYIDIGELKNNVFFSTSSTTVAARLPPIAPRDVSAMFGRRHPNTCRVPRHQLLAALDSACETTGGVEVVLRLIADGVVVSAEAPSRGSMSDEIIGVRSGAAAEIKINAKYLREAANALGDNDIALEIGGRLEPLIVRPSEGNDAEVVIMPMQ